MGWESSSLRTEAPVGLRHRAARAAVWSLCTVAVLVGEANVAAQTLTPKFKPLPGGSEVQDTRHHLIWRRCSEGQAWAADRCVGVATVFSWADAVNQASTQAAASGQAWRLPTQDELRQLVQTRRQEPRAARIHPGMFPNTPAGWFWTSTPDPTNAELAGVVDFMTGQPGFDLKTSGLGGEVRLVRDGR